MSLKPCYIHTAGSINIYHWIVCSIGWYYLQLLVTKSLCRTSSPTASSCSLWSQLLAFVLILSSLKHLKLEQVYFRCGY